MQDARLDSEPVEALTGTHVDLVTADKGYAWSANNKALGDRGTASVIPPRRIAKHPVGLQRLPYDAKHDLVGCPRGRKLRPAARAGDDGHFYRARRSRFVAPRAVLVRQCPQGPVHFGLLTTLRCPPGSYHVDG